MTRLVRWLNVALRRETERGLEPLAWAAKFVGLALLESKKLRVWETAATLQKLVVLRRVLVQAPDVLELARPSSKHRLTRTVPQGGMPSVLLASSYSYRDWAEYSRANLNGRLIDGGELMANVEHVAFAAACVQQFERVFSVDLFAQAVHVDLDRV